MRSDFSVPFNMSQPQQVNTTNVRSQAAVNLANFVRDHKILKVRTGLLNNKEDIDFFRYKRYVRVLTSEEYKKAQANPKNGLIPIANEEDVAKSFVMLIQSQMIIPLKKLHYGEIKAANKSWKPNRTKPTLIPTQKALLDADEYFGWRYTKPNPYMALYGVLLLVGVFAVILFPLWPNFMRIGVWYLSMGMLGLIGLFFAIAIVRLIIYIISILALPQGFWLYPNLFADCLVLESFRPLYEWEVPKQAKKKKGKKGIGAEVSSEPVASAPANDASGASQTETSATKRKVVLEEVDE